MATGGRGQQIHVGVRGEKRKRGYRKNPWKGKGFILFIFVTKVSYN
jgi:hypothetical protein